MDDKKLISIVTPCYNEEDNVSTCYETVRQVFETHLPAYRYEHIFCDNASSDRTVAGLKEIAARDKRVKIIVNSRNFGPFHSLYNGLMNTQGDAVVVFLAADLQDPPELIPEFVHKWEDGYDVVYGIRKTREEGFFMRSVRAAYYRLVAQLAHINLVPGVGEFQVVDRKIIESLREFEDYYPYVRGMIAYCGFRATGVEYTWKSRKRGLSKNSFLRLIDQGLNGLISFTKVPLRLCMAFGLVVAILAILYAVVGFVINIVYFRQLAPPGIPTLIVALFFFSGIQLFAFGIIGEYIGAIHFQVRKRPLVLERERINFDEARSGRVDSRLSGQPSAAHRPDHRGLPSEASHCTPE
jgi:polyisoprenyl-phosphate glycosyltransferase